MREILDKPVNAQKSLKKFQGSHKPMKKIVCLIADTMKILAICLVNE